MSHANKGPGQRCKTGNKSNDSHGVAMACWPAGDCYAESKSIPFISYY